jgi:hypothetical protein
MLSSPFTFTISFCASLLGTTTRNIQSGVSLPHRLEEFSTIIEEQLRLCWDIVQCIELNMVLPNDNLEPCSHVRVVTVVDKAHFVPSTPCVDRITAANVEKIRTMLLGFAIYASFLGFVVRDELSNVLVNNFILLDMSFRKASPAMDSGLSHQ